MELIDTHQHLMYRDQVGYSWANEFPPIDKGMVVKIYDGDTITIAAKLPYSSSPLYRFSVRLNGIDTPELHTKNLEEKEMAENARDALKMQIMNKEVELKNTKTEKYGRLLADVYCENFYINELKLRNTSFKLKPTSYYIFLIGFNNFSTMGMSPF